MENTSFTTKDGYRLMGVIYRPVESANIPVSSSAEHLPVHQKGAVLVVCAMGVPQSFYRAFCQWLAERGYVAMTFDFRGMGLSRPQNLRRVDADVMTWAELDAAAALEHLAALVPEVPVTWLGHSLGGQIYPFTLDQVDAAVAARVKKFSYIAAGSGYWRENAAPTKRMSWLFWFVLGPVLTPLFGYWPGARLGIVGDLPKGVFYQWKKWCMHRDYAVGVLPSKYRALAAKVNVPITVISFTDDEMMSEKNIKSLQATYPPHALKSLRFSPADLGVQRVGHFGAFRKEMRAPIWERVVLAELHTETT